MNTKETIGLIARYISLAILPLGGLYLFYAIFTPLTVYSAHWILTYTAGAGELSYLGGFLNLAIAQIPLMDSFGRWENAEIVDACVAGAAYYLLMILNLTTPMHIKKRIKSVLFLLLTFLIINIIRISVFGIIFSQGYRYFDIAHELTWYFGSTIIVVLVWFTNVWLFKIKSIPIYTDMANLFADITQSNGDKK